MVHQYLAHQSKAYALPVFFGAVEWGKQLFALFWGDALATSARSAQ
jgi:hypothetical protein